MTCYFTAVLRLRSNSPKILCSCFQRCLARLRVHAPTEPPRGSSESTHRPLSYVNIHEQSWLEHLTLPLSLPVQYTVLIISWQTPTPRVFCRNSSPALVHPIRCPGPRQYARTTTGRDMMPPRSSQSRYTRALFANTRQGDRAGDYYRWPR